MNRILPTLFLTLVLSLGVLAPTLASAQADYVEINKAESTITEGQGFVPCEGAGCNACHVVVLINTIIKWLITMSFLFFAFLAVTAGVKLVTSGGNPGAMQDAKSSFTNAFIGLFIVLGAWLLVDTLLRGVLREGGVGVSGRPWSEIQCGEQAVPETIILEEEPSFYRDSEVPINTSVVSGTNQQKISSAANSFKGASTASGPGGGSVACAWAVNKVLDNAGIATVGGNSVREMEKVLVDGRGARVAQTQAVAGDLVILTGAKTKSNKTGNHVGICLNTGCTQVISNSSSRKSFSWVSGPTFAPSYVGASPRFYRVTN